MPIVIFSAVVLLIFTSIAVFAYRSELREDELTRFLARDNSEFDVQNDHEQICAMRAD